MKETNPADGSFVNQPTCAPGLFETDESLGYQYADIVVLGAKLTLVWRPLPSQLNETSADASTKQETVVGHDTEPAQLYCFLHTQSAQGAVDALANKDTRWVGGLADVPYIRGRDISGNVSAQGGPDNFNYRTNKQGNAAVLQYKYSTSTVHQCDPLDEPQFHTRTDQTNGFANPSELDHLTFGIRRNLSGDTARCAPSGYIELRLEQIIMLKKPMSTRTQYLAQQAAPVGGGGAAPGGAAPGRDHMEL